MTYCRTGQKHGLPKIRSKSGQNFEGPNNDKISKSIRKCEINEFCMNGGSAFFALQAVLRAWGSASSPARLICWSLWSVRFMLQISPDFSPTASCIRIFCSSLFSHMNINPICIVFSRCLIEKLIKAFLTL